MKKSTAQSKFGFLNLEDSEMAFMENPSNPPVVMHLYLHIRKNQQQLEGRLCPKFYRMPFVNPHLI